MQLKAGARWRSVARTSSSAPVLPFQVEMVRGRNVRCYPGRVFDPESMTINNEAGVKSAVKNPTNKSSGGLPPASAINRVVHSGTYATSILTGSAVINCKATSGRCTLANSAAIDANEGYAEWAIDQLTADSYVVLHRNNTNKLWFVSLLQAADLQAGDVKLACIRNFRDVQQLWKSDVYFVAGSAPDHPYKVKGVVNGQDIDLTIVDGHVNNVTLSNAAATNTITGAAAGTYKAYIVVNKTGTTFPSTITWAVTGLNAAVPANDDTKAHVLLANVVVTVTNNVPSFTITQMVSTSLNTIRVKHNTGAADVVYLFNRV